MRAIQYEEYGTHQVLDCKEINRPEPGPNEVQVQVKAASVNPIDIQQQEGYRSVQLPMIPGSDFAGIVSDVGKEISSFEIGDRVFGTGMHTKQTQYGTYSDYTLVNPDLMAKLPESVPFDIGASIALVGVTTWRALVDHSNLSPGETCLIHGGSGGVGHVAVQFADMVGARVISTAGTESARNRVQELGADIVLDYSRDDLAQLVKGTIDGRPDVILDHRHDEYIQFNADVAAFGGRVVEIGGMSGVMSNMGTARGKELNVTHMAMVNLVEQPSLPDIGEILTKLAYPLSKERLSSDIAYRFNLEDACKAHSTLEDKQFVGKIVILP